MFDFINNHWLQLVDVATFPGAVVASLAAAGITATISYTLSKTFLKRSANKEKCFFAFSASWRDIKQK